MKKNAEAAINSEIKNAKTQSEDDVSSALDQAKKAKVTTATRIHR